MSFVKNALLFGGGILISVLGLLGLAMCIAMGIEALFFSHEHVGGDLAALGFLLVCMLGIIPWAVLGLGMGMIKIASKHFEWEKLERFARIILNFMF